MRFGTLSVMLLALSTSAYAAGTKVVATKVDGVTLDQLKAATSPIPIAKFDVDGAHMSLKCAGSTGNLICEVWNTDKTEIVAASSDLKICRDGNDVAIMGDKVGAGKMIVIPQGMFIGDPSKTMVCAG